MLLRSLRTAVAPVILFLCAIVSLADLAAAADAELLAEKLQNPESVVMGTDGKIYVTIQGAMNVEGDGQVVAIEKGEARIVAKGFDDPKGIDKRGDELFLADRVRVRRIDTKTGEASIYVDADKFPSRPRLLNDLSVGPKGDIFVSDLSGGIVFRISPDKEVTTVVDAKSVPTVRPNGVLADGPDHVIVLEFMGGKAFRVSLADRSLTEIAKGLGSPDGVVRDGKGRLYFTDNRGGRILRTDPAGGEPTVFVQGMRNPADLCFDPAGRLLIPETGPGKLHAHPIKD